jgi:subtilisin family serine protease
MMWNWQKGDVKTGANMQRVRRHLNSLVSMVAVAVAVLATGLDSVEAGSGYERYHNRLDSQSQPTTRVQNRWAEGRILVQPRSDVADIVMDDMVKRRGAKGLKARIQKTNVRIVEVEAGQEESMVQALMADPDVAYAEVDRLVEVESTTANDTYYSNAWHLQTLGMPAAWDFAKGDGVVVAVLDTGVDGSHPDLAGRLVPGWNLYDNNSNTSDVYGHGTKVAGTVAALSNNAVGVTSIAWNAYVMPVRISQLDGMAYLSTIANGITWAADHGADIANISYASLAGSSTIQNAAQYMRNKGGLVVVAAGNAGVQENVSNTSTMISVSATVSSDALASWSSYGNYVDVAAPGSGIWTTANGGGYASVSGTSFASPATAAVLAVMMSANPSLSNTELEQLLLGTAVDLGTPGYDIYFGNGRINAAAAVTAAANAGGNTPPPAPEADTLAPSVGIASPTGGNVAGSVSVSVGATDNIGVTRVDLYVGGVLFGSDTSAPYTFSVNTLNYVNGTLSLSARARDAAGNVTTSSGVNVNVANPVPDTLAPVVNILSPSDGGTVSGRSVSISISASDNVRVTLLSCYVDGKLLSQTTASSMTCKWNTSKVSKGLHVIGATATDAAGNSSKTQISVNYGSATTTSKTSKGKRSSSTDSETDTKRRSRR